MFSCHVTPLECAVFVSIQILTILLTRIFARIDSQILTEFLTLKISCFYDDFSKILAKISPKIKVLVSQAQSRPTVFSYSSSALNLCLKVFTKLPDSSCKSTSFFSFSEGTSPSDTSFARTKSTPSPHVERRTHACPWPTDLIDFIFGKTKKS